MTSGHFAICGFAPNSQQVREKPPPSDGKFRVPRMMQPKFAQIVSQWLPSLTTLNTTEGTEIFAQDIYWALENALKAVAKQASKDNGRSAP